jgi:hypothetical protein
VAAGFTFAVRATVWPTVDGFWLEAKVKPALSFTLCETAADVDAALLASPL